MKKSFFGHVNIQGCQIPATLSNHYFFNNWYSFYSISMKFWYNIHIINPKETLTLKFWFSIFLENCEISKFRNPIIFEKNQKSIFLCMGFLWIYSENTVYKFHWNRIKTVVVIKILMIWQGCRDLATLQSLMTKNTFFHWKLLL